MLLRVDVALELRVAGAVAAIWVGAIVVLLLPFVEVLAVEVVM